MKTKKFFASRNEELSIHAFDLSRSSAFELCSCTRYKATNWFSISLFLLQIRMSSSVAGSLQRLLLAALSQAGQVKSQWLINRDKNEMVENCIKKNHFRSLIARLLSVVDTFNYNILCAHTYMFMRVLSDRCGKFISCSPFRWNLCGEHIERNRNHWAGLFGLLNIHQHIERAEFWKLYSEIRMLISDGRCKCKCQLVSLHIIELEKNPCNSYIYLQTQR